MGRLVALELPLDLARHREPPQVLEVIGHGWLFDGLGRRTLSAWGSVFDENQSPGQIDAPKTETMFRVLF